MSRDGGAQLAGRLRAAGFRVVFDRGAWWRCLVEDEGGSWVGEGASASSALEEALRRLVPSRLARERLIEGLPAAPQAPADAEGEAVLPAAPQAIADAESEAVPSAAPQAPADAEGEAVPPAPEGVAAAAEESCSTIAAEESLSTTAAETDTAPLRFPESESSVPVAGAAPPLDPGEAVAMLAALHTEVRDAAAEIGELAPRSMRLVFLAWIARARSVAERLPGKRHIEDQVYAIATEIGSLARDFWPGTVPALKKHTLPADCRWILDPDRGEFEPRTWSEVAERAEAAIAAAEPGARDGGLGDATADEDGWSDEDALEPPPLAPDALLAELRRRLDRLFAGASASQDVIPSREALARDGLRSELLEMARKVRWLRGATSDPRAWGLVAGRLRHAAIFAERVFPELGVLLDPRYRPASGSWARELGQDPEAKRRRRERRRVFIARPRPGEVDANVLRAWILDAFDVLDTPELAVLLREQAEEVVALAAEDMPDRRRRGRLRTLQKALAEGAGDIGDRSVLEEAEQALAGDAATADARAESAVAGDADGAVVDFLEVLRSRVLPRTMGRSILFVSNREDPRLRDDLGKGLEPGSLDWCEAKERRVAAAVARIERRRYDMVLCATGFISHGTEYALRDACRAAGVPYVRAYKGRLASCLRAIERDTEGSGNGGR